MADEKFKFDPESLQYDNVDPSGKKKILSGVLTQIASAVLFTIIFYVAFAYLFESPKQKKLKKENEIMEEEYKILIERYLQTSKVLEDLQQRDDNIYRAIFEAEPPKKDTFLTLEDFNHIDETELARANDAKMLQLQQKLAELEEFYNQIIAKLLEKKADLTKTPSIQPIANEDIKLVTYGYGKKMDPVYKTPSFHHGMDFAAPKGTEVYATAEGVITRADEKVRGYGKHIRIKHGSEYETVYAHLSEILVDVGDKVKKGQLIAFVGNTGKSLVSHLHYEIHYKKNAVNPVNFFFQELTPTQYAIIVEESARSGLSLD